MAYRKMIYAFVFHNFLCHLMSIGASDAWLKARAVLTYFVTDSLREGGWFEPGTEGGRMALSQYQQFIFQRCCVSRRPPAVTLLHPPVVALPSPAVSALPAFLMLTRVRDMRLRAGKS